LNRIPAIQEIIDWAAVSASQAIKSARRRMTSLKCCRPLGKAGLDNHPKFIV
jgi:hypothetical protein